MCHRLSGLLEGQFCVARLFYRVINLLLNKLCKQRNYYVNCLCVREGGWALLSCQREGGWAGTVTGESGWAQNFTSAYKSYFCDSHRNLTKCLLILFSVYSLVRIRDFRNKCLTSCFLKVSNEKSHQLLLICKTSTVVEFQDRRNVKSPMTRTVKRDLETYHGIRTTWRWSNIWFR